MHQKLQLMFTFSPTTVREEIKEGKKLRGLSPRANYTDRAAGEVSANFCG